MVSFGELSEDCVSNIILRTSPWDACRASSISLVFKSAADSDATWEQFFPANYRQILSGSVAPLVANLLNCRRVHIRGKIQQPSVINVTRLLTTEHNITTLDCSQPNEGLESMTFYGISYSIESNRVYKPATRLRRTE
ncbi:hypothetical protein LguiA_001474 [Lonicera macranthoides]